LCAGDLFNIEECHLPEKSFVSSTSSKVAQLYPEKSKNRSPSLKDPKPASLA
jgi:hypothetical protein